MARGRGHRRGAGGPALPALGMRVVSSGVQLLPTDATQRLFFEELARDYPATSQAPVTVVGRTTLGAAQQWARARPRSLA